MTGSGWRSGGQHQQANYCHRAVIYPSRPSRHGSSCPTGASAPEVTKAWLVGLGGRPGSNFHDVFWFPEFRMPAVSGLTAAVLLVGFGWWIPESQQPSAWWAIAPFLLYAVVAVVLAR